MLAIAALAQPHTTAGDPLHRIDIGGGAKRFSYCGRAYLLAATYGGIARDDPIQRLRGVGDIIQHCCKTHGGLATLAERTGASGRVTVRDQSQGCGNAKTRDTAFIPRNRGSGYSGGLARHPDPLNRALHPLIVARRPATRRRRPPHGKARLPGQVRLGKKAIAKPDRTAWRRLRVISLPEHRARHTIRPGNLLQWTPETHGDACPAQVQHGLACFAQQRAISRRGGTMPYHRLADGREGSIEGDFGDLAA